MPRGPRIEGAGLIHHVTGHSIVELDAFPDDQARRGFLSLLGSIAIRSGWDVLAYTVLSTHYHVLVQTPRANLGRGMRTIHGRHTARLNARLGRFGPLWRDRYHNRVVTSGAHAVRAAAYIDLNAVKAGLCDHPAEWRWSSYRANAALAEPWAWHRPERLYDHMGAACSEAPAVYRALVTALDEHARAHG